MLAIESYFETLFLWINLKSEGTKLKEERGKEKEEKRRKGRGEKGRGKEKETKEEEKRKTDTALWQLPEGEGVGGVPTEEGERG